MDCMIILDGPVVFEIAYTFQRQQGRADGRLQQLGLAGIGDDGFNAPPPARDNEAVDLLQIGVERLLAKVDALKAGAEKMGQVAGDEDDRLLFHIAQPAELDNWRRRKYFEMPGDRGGRWNHRLGEHAAERPSPLLLHVLVEACELLRQALGDLGLGHERAFALAPDDEAIGLEHAEGLAHDGAAHGIGFAQAVLTGQLVACLPDALLDVVSQKVEQLDIERDGAIEVDLVVHGRFYLGT